tara:strand:- start:50 stop:472 length:423 start_codon:yes stop_codon:yes gene_type:complete
MIKETTKALNKEHNRVAEQSNKSKYDLSKSDINVSATRGAILGDTAVLDKGLFNKYKNDLPKEFKLACAFVDTQGGTAPTLEVCEAWDMQIVKKGVYKQDLVDVVKHYFGRFASTKGYKNLPSKDLLNILIFENTSGVNI